MSKDTTKNTVNIRVFKKTYKRLKHQAVERETTLMGALEEIVP